MRFLACLLLALCLPAWADAPARPAEATLRVLTRDIVTLRAPLAGASPEARVERALQRLRQIPQAEYDQPIRHVPFALGDERGVQFLLGDRTLFTLLEADRQAESKESLEAMAVGVQANLEALRADWHRMQDDRLLAEGLARALVATALFALAGWLLAAGTRRLRARLAEWRRATQQASTFSVRELAARFAGGAAFAAAALLLAGLGFLWLRLLLGAFVLTEPLARELGAWLWHKAAWAGEGIVGALPGLFTVAIVLALTRATVDVVAAFFRAVERGRVTLPWFHPETVGATRRIVTIIAWGLGIAVAYPYLPGSSSDAFKGLSVLFGLMITLGSTGLVTQAMSGLVVIYSRALREGDYVEVNGVQGVVREVAALATKIVNIRNEEITVPNSVLISSPIYNYSKLATDQGTLVSTKVTIGYDAPWREVHALLVSAAKATAGVRATPEPYVYQRALADFYVEYELFVSIDLAIRRVPILSALHANIQDAFNEAGVQIMSPHFMVQPERPVVAPPPPRA